MQSTSFRITALDTAGQLRISVFEALTGEVAREQALKLGWHVLQCEEDRAPQALHKQVFSKFKREGQTTLDLVAFSQDLATLLAAGVTVRDALHALAQREIAAARQAILRRLQQRVSEGQSLSAAMTQAGGFPDVLVATVAASEQTGDLSTGLTRYAQHQQSLRGVRDRVVGASIYPLLLLVVGSAIVLLLLGVVVPRFATLIDVSGRELPALSRALMAWGRFAGEHPGAVAGLFISLGVVVVIAILRLRSTSARRQLMQKVPGFARVAREFQHLQLYRTAAILTSRGITIQKALPYTTSLLSPTDQARLDEALSTMREGVNLSTALARAGIADVVATSMLSVAERTGSLSEMLDRIADFYERSLQRRIDIVSRLIEPVMMIVFGVLVGGIVIMMYLPIFDLAASIN